MAAIRLGPKCKLPSLVFAELGVGEQYLEELGFDQERSVTTSIRDLDLQIAHRPHAFGSLRGRFGGGITVREPSPNGLIKIQTVFR